MEASGGAGPGRGRGMQFQVPHFDENSILISIKDTFNEIIISTERIKRCGLDGIVSLFKAVTGNLTMIWVKLNEPSIN